MFLAMLFVKVILVICFLCVGFLYNWLNADRNQNCKKIDRSILSIFRPSVLVRKYCYTSDTKQVPPQLKFKNLLLLLLLCGDVASNPGPTSFGFVNCRSIRNKGPLLQDLLKRGNLDILGLVETHIRPNDTEVLLHWLITISSKNQGALVGEVVLVFCVEKPFHRVLSLHQFSGHLKLSYFCSRLIIIALLWLVCTVLLVLVLLSFWKIFWLSVFDWFQFHHLW